MIKRKRRYASRDYTAGMLPQTRKAVFFDVMKLHWFDLVKLGLLFLVAFLPLIISVFSVDGYQSGVLAELPQNADQAQIREAYASIVSFQSTSALLDILGYCLIAVVLAGAIRVIRQLAYEEVLFFWRDFLIGIRQNWKQLLLIAVLMGLQKFFGVYLYGAGTLAEKGIVGMVGAVFNALSLVVFLPIWAYMTVLTGVYDNRFLQNFRLGLSLYSKAVLQTVGHLIALGCILAAAMLPITLCHVICRGAGAFLLPTSLLIWSLFVFNQLDRYINPKFFPELVDRGLYNPETEQTGSNQTFDEGVPAKAEQR